MNQWRKWMDIWGWWMMVMIDGDLIQSLNYIVNIDDDYMIVALNHVVSSFFSIYMSYILYIWNKLKSSKCHHYKAFQLYELYHINKVGPRAQSILLGLPGEITHPKKGGLVETAPCRCWLFLCFCCWLFTPKKKMGEDDNSLPLHNCLQFNRVSNKTLINPYKSIPCQCHDYNCEQFWSNK